MKKNSNKFKLVLSIFIYALVQANSTQAKLAPAYAALGFKSTALHQAVQDNNLDLVKELITKKAVDINAPDEYGLPALYYAVTFNEPLIVALLVKAGANTHIYNKENHETLLEMARRFAQTEEDLQEKQKTEEIINLLETRLPLKLKTT